jgi:hypothetical protein
VKATRRLNHAIAIGNKSVGSAFIEVATRYEVISVLQSLGSIGKPLKGRGALKWFLKCFKPKVQEILNFE